MLFVLLLVISIFVINFFDYFSESYCKVTFLVEINKTEDFKKFFFYQSNLYELKNNFLCLGAVEGNVVTYSAFGYIIFLQVIPLMIFVVLKKIKFLNIFNKIIIIFFYIFLLEYLFNFKANLNLLNYVSLSQTAILVGLLYANEKK